MFSRESSASLFLLHCFQASHRRMAPVPGKKKRLAASESFIQESKSQLQSPQPFPIDRTHKCHMPHGCLAPQDIRRAWSRFFWFLQRKDLLLLLCRCCCFTFCFASCNSQKPYSVLWNGSASSSQGLICYCIAVISQPGRENIEEKGKKLPFKDVMQNLKSLLLFCSHPIGQNLDT